MQEQILFSSPDAVVTPHVAKFGNTSYQISNVVSVAIHVHRLFNSFAVFLFLAALAALAWAGTFYENDNQVSLGAGIAGLLLIVFAVIVQNVWPRLEYRFVLKLSNNEALEI
jgi:hypothetical protein